MKKESLKMKEEGVTRLITPLRDFVISHNDVIIEVKEGAPIEIPLRYIENLKTEKVIKE